MFWNDCIQQFFYQFVIWHARVCNRENKNKRAGIKQTKYHNLPIHKKHTHNTAIGFDSLFASWVTLCCDYVFAFQKKRRFLRDKKLKTKRWKKIFTKRWQKTLKKGIHKNCWQCLCFFCTCDGQFVFVPLEFTMTEKNKRNNIQNNEN